MLSNLSPPLGRRDNLGDGTGGSWSPSSASISSIDACVFDILFVDSVNDSTCVFFDMQVSTQRRRWPNPCRFAVAQGTGVEEQPLKRLLRTLTPPPFPPLQVVAARRQFGNGGATRLGGSCAAAASAARCTVRCGLRAPGRRQRGERLAAARGGSQAAATFLLLPCCAVCVCWRV